MSAEEINTLGRRVPLKMLNDGNTAVADEIFDQNYVDHEPPPGIPVGIPGLNLFVTQLRTAFPDFQYTVEDEIAEGDKVV